MSNTILIFLASVTGILSYFTTLATPAFITVTILLVVGIGATAFAHLSLEADPVLSTRLFVGWRVVPLTVIFLAGFLSAYLSQNALDWTFFEFTNGPDETVTAETLEKRKNAASTLIIAAANTFLGAVVLDAAKDTKSWFWPGERQRKAWARLYAGRTNIDMTGKPAAARQALEDLRDAYGETHAPEAQAEGWSYEARLKRAKHIQTSTATLNSHGIVI